MRTWFEIMQVGHEEQQRQMAEQETQKVADFKQRTTPVIDRLRKFVTTVPPSEKYPRSITFFSQALRPRHHGKFASQREVADALRQLGFTRHRGWNNSEAGFRSHWHFPESDTPGAK